MAFFYLSHFRSPMGNGDRAIDGVDGQLEVEGGAAAAVRVGNRHERNPSFLPEIVLQKTFFFRRNFTFLLFYYFFPLIFNLSENTKRSSL